MKKRLSCLFILLGVIFFGVNVHAASCSAEELKNMKLEAQNIEFKYELVLKNYANSADEDYGYDVILTGINDRFYFLAGNYDYLVDYSKAVDGSITISNVFNDGGYKSKIKVYGSSKSECKDELVRTIYITFPYYNSYSTRKECKGLEEYKICQKTTNTTNIKEQQFLEQIENAKKIEKSKKEKQEPKQKEEKNIFVEFFNYYSKNKIYTIPLTIALVVIVVVIAFMISKKKKKQIKIDLKEV